MSVTNQLFKEPKEIEIYRKMDEKTQQEVDAIALNKKNYAFLEQTGFDNLNPIMKNKTVKLAKTLSNDQSTSQTPTALFGTANKTTPSAQMPISPFSTSTQNTQEPSKESGSGLSQ